MFLSLSRVPIFLNVTLFFSKKITFRVKKYYQVRLFIICS